MQKNELDILTIGENGQVTFPESMRRRLGLEKDSKIAATMVGKTIVIHPINLKLEELLDNLENKLEDTGVTEKELLEKAEKTRQRIYDENYNTKISE